MTDFIPTIEQAREAYAALKQSYEANAIKRRLGLSERTTLEQIFTSPSRRVRLVNWAKSAQLFDEQYERRGPR